MSTYTRQIETTRYWIRDRIFLGLTMPQYLKGLLTPFNAIAGTIALTGLVLVVIRFAQGLGSVTAASQDQPWGLFLSAGLFSVVPLSGAGFVLGTAVYLLGLRQYEPVVKNALLLGLLGYLFAVIFLIIDLGRPWRLPYPMLGSFGTTSVLFLVAWHVALYLSCQLLEVAPSIFEWAGWRKLRKWAISLTIGLTIFGVILSTLHQSALGALLLLAPGKLHPLWYTPYLPVLFLVSAIAAALCNVMFVGFLTKRFLKDKADSSYLTSLPGITLGLGKAASFVLMTYFILKVIALAHGDNWALLNTAYGYWFLLELLVFVLLPCLLFAFAATKRKVGLVQFTALLTIVGIVMNRLNVSLITLNWQLEEHEIFDWREFLIVIGILSIAVLLYRWIVSRMPILREHPEYRGEHH
jgi:Ni/Fe-hydrogenase subunit HybB-like protein